jgi:hypothetical protein
MTMSSSSASPRTLQSLVELMANPPRSILARALLAKTAAIELQQSVRVSSSSSGRALLSVLLVGIASLYALVAAWQLRACLWLMRRALLILTTPGRLRSSSLTEASLHNISVMEIVSDKS